MSRIVLAAGSIADDLGYGALADISGVLGTQTTDYRIIGCLMVTALAARWDLCASLYRETLDANHLHFQSREAPSRIAIALRPARLGDP
jgi:hypothetical protein